MDFFDFKSSLSPLLDATDALPFSALFSLGDEIWKATYRSSSATDMER